jgi:hypothetical protein
VVSLDELEILFGDLEQVEFLAFVIRDLYELGGPVIDKSGPLGAGRPSPKRPLQLDDVVFGDPRFGNCHPLPLDLLRERIDKSRRDERRGQLPNRPQTSHPVTVALDSAMGELDYATPPIRSIPRCLRPSFVMIERQLRDVG